MNYGRISNFIDTKLLSQTNIDEIISQADLNVVCGLLDEVMAKGKMRGKNVKLPEGVFEKIVSHRRFYVMNEEKCFGFGFNLTAKSSILISGHRNKLIIEEFNTDNERCYNRLVFEDRNLIESFGDDFYLKSNQQSK